MSGFQLSTQSAQRIVAEIGGIVGQNINMMDAQGYIIASTDPAHRLFTRGRAPDY